MEKKLIVKIQYLNDDIVRLEKIKKGDWIDLRSAVTVKLNKGESVLIPLGVAMKLPEGYEANIVPRSSTFKKWKIIQTNHYGVIDNSYCGPNDWWYFPAYATEDTVIEKDSRICQFRINEIQPDFDFEEADLSGKDRGGFGSTGEK